MTKEMDLWFEVLFFFFVFFLKVLPVSHHLQSESFMLPAKASFDVLFLRTSLWLLASSALDHFRRSQCRSPQTKLENEDDQNSMLFNNVLN